MCDVDDPSKVFVADDFDERGRGTIGSCSEAEGGPQMTEAQADALCEALRLRFAGSAEREPVNGHGRYRFALTSDRFAGMPQLRRQDEIWQVVDATLPREATLDVS